MNNWKQIWSARKQTSFAKGEYSKEAFMELKNLNGFDSVDGGISYENLCKQYDGMIQNLQRYSQIESIFEIGCGSGANLFMAERDNIKTGGIDYSESLIQTARTALKSNDLTVGEAIDIPELPVYDAVISNSVFGYFESDEYAEQAVRKAIHKAEKVVALLDVHDEAKKEALLAYQRQVKENYDERYKDLPVRCYEKSWFQKIGAEYGLEVIFTDLDMSDYWNAAFSYNVYFYHKSNEKIR